MHLNPGSILLFYFKSLQHFVCIQIQAVFCLHSNPGNILFQILVAFCLHSNPGSILFLHLNPGSILFLHSNPGNILFLYLNPGSILFLHSNPGSILFLYSNPGSILFQILAAFCFKSWQHFISNPGSILFASKLTRNYRLTLPLPMELMPSFKMKPFFFTSSSLLFTFF